MIDLLTYDAHFSKHNRVFVKISVILKYERFNNDLVITQHTPKCVENCSGDQLLYTCLSNYYQIFCNFDYNSENSAFFVKYQTNSLVMTCA